MTITATDIKRNGVSMFDALLNKVDEFIINVRGKDKYVVLDIERYRAFRAGELDLAYLQTQRDIEAGRYAVHNAQEHMDEVRNHSISNHDDVYGK